jgi:hypothetical protein
MTRLVLAGAAAGAMGWGIRGQYGHETGAMIAGLLVSLVIVQTVRPQAPAWWAMRAAAFGTIGAGFGGAMTYGQTIGLTQDASLVGNWAALRWGLLGLSLKGAVWIGLFGAFLGMGLGQVRYRARELGLLMLALVCVALAGSWWLNEPHDPAARVLPRLYFSASWYWHPDAVDLQPRREGWGGLLVALGALGVYAGAIRRDRLALRLIGWGLLGGAVGFPLGQCLQAFHAWNPEVFTHGPWVGLAPHVNWWNAMETTFGAVMGAAVAAGAWLNRDLVAASPSFTTDRDRAGAVGHLPRLTPSVEWLGLAVHVGLLMIAEFTDVPVLGRYTDVALVLGVVPLALVTGGVWAPALVVLPVTMLPIAGKTLRRVVYQQHASAPWLGWLAFVVVPVGLACGLAWWIVRRADRDEGRGRAARVALLFTTWTYLGLNFAVFEYPWPWVAWTSRTLHALVFVACAVVVTASVVAPDRPLPPRGPRP